MTTPPDGPPPGPDPDRTAGQPYGTPPPGPYGAPPPGPYGAPPSPSGALPREGYGTQPSAQQVPYGAPAGTGDQGGHGVQPQAGPPTDVVSVVGLVLAFVLPPVGLVLSIVGLGRTSGGRRKGRGLAIAGTIVSVITSLLLAAAVVALVALGSFLVGEAGTTLEELEDSFPTAEPFSVEPFTAPPLPSLDPVPSEAPEPTTSDATNAWSDR